MAHFRVAVNLLFKPRPSAKISFSSHANKTYTHMNGFALGLGLKRRIRATRKWAIHFVGVISIRF